jgi:three-Cys-motif partner protein
MATKKDWTIKANTKTKLQMLNDIFDIWITIWNGQKQQKWVAKEWYIIDLFAGRGWYDDNGIKTNGSPLVFLEKILEHENKLRKNGIKIKLFFIENTLKNFNDLKKRISEFKKNHQSLKDFVEFNIYKEDCNIKTKNIIRQIINSPQNPIFLFIDPYGINIKKETIKTFLNLFNPIDIFFNYSKAGESRTRGIAIKNSSTTNTKTVKTIITLEEFLGKDVDYKTRKDLDLLKNYAETLFIANMYNMVGFNMEYPNRKDIIYYLLFASKNKTITNDIVKKIYAKYQEKISGQTLFGTEFYLASTLSLSPQITGKQRQSLLYKTKVEYGNWTINHITGCMHGCNFPCYAMMMARKFGWVKNYDDWRKPVIAINALEVLEKEISKYKNKIDFVHLCFMSDPFMYDSDKNNLIPEIKEMTLKIIEKLNKENIKVTTLTKGFYPDEILDQKRFSRENEYGITLVSLNKNFKDKYEPFSASYEKRIESLKKLNRAGLKTWVSMEPYPTPQLPKLKNTEAEKIDKILERIKFVKKIVFGKLNYSRLNYYNGNYSQTYGSSNDFYKEMAQKVINFCEKNNIEHHIKYGTPLSRKDTKNIFK